MSTPTPFEAFLNTNYIPSEHEITLIQEIVVQRKAEADALALKIEQMEKALPLLMEQRASSLRGAEEHLALLSPARRVPPEVLEPIFLDCLPGTESGLAPGISSPRHPSINLSHVCRSWRSTSLGCPKMWADLRINLPNFDDGKEGSGWVHKMEKLMKAFGIWTHRSGNAPLTVVVSSIDFPDGIVDASEVNKAYSDLVRAIQETSARWRELKVVLVVGPDCESLLQLMHFESTSLPLLERASLEVSSGSVEWDIDLTTRLQGLLASSNLFSTPSLRSLTLRGVWGDTALPSVMNVNLWPPLTALNIDCHYPRDLVTPTMSAMQLIQHLHAIPSLLDVSFSFQGRSSVSNQLPFPNVGNPLEIPNLKRLMLTGGQILKGFGPFLSFPALQDLHLQFRDLIPDGIESGLVECILQFGPQLKTFTFCPDAVSRYAFVKVLESLPRVETLTLDAQGSASHFTYTAERPGVDCYAVMELNAEGVGSVGVNDGKVADDLLRCPQLRRLRLRATRDRYDDDGVEQALVEFIARRRGRAWVSGEFRLEEVSVTFQQERRAGAPDILQELKDWGADLRGFTLRLVYP